MTTSGEAPKPQPGEALAALRLFVEAARADAAHLNLVADLRNYLRDAQADREHRFR